MGGQEEGEGKEERERKGFVCRWGGRWQMGIEGERCPLLWTPPCCLPGDLAACESSTHLQASHPGALDSLLALVLQVQGKWTCLMLPSYPFKIHAPLLSTLSLLLPLLSLSHPAPQCPGSDLILWGLKPLLFSLSQIPLSFSGALLPGGHLSSSLIPWFLDPLMSSDKPSPLPHLFIPWTPPSPESRQPLESRCQHPSLRPSPPLSSHLLFHLTSSVILF